MSVGLNLLVSVAARDELQQIGREIAEAIQALGHVKKPAGLVDWQNAFRLVNMPCSVSPLVLGRD